MTVVVGVVCGRLLLEGKADPDKARITDGVTPMYWAADKGHEAVVRCCGRMRGVVRATSGWVVVWSGVICMCADLSPVVVVPAASACML